MLLFAYAILVHLRRFFEVVTQKPMEGSAEKKVIVVTGGSGLVGRAIKEVVEEHGLKQEGEEWIFLASKDADLTNIAETEEKVFQKYQPTHIIHLAAMVGGLFKNMRLKVEFFRQNFLINDTILSLSHKYKVGSNCSCPTNAQLSLKVKKVVSCLSTW